MITLKDERTAQYLEKLREQKTLYEQIVQLSQKEEQLLKTTPIALGKLVEVLQAKETLLNHIQEIEQDISALRALIQAAGGVMDEQSRAQATKHLSEIGTLLKRLLEKDVDNENLLKAYVPASPAQNSVFNRQYALKAYGATR